MLAAPPGPPSRTLMPESHGSATTAAASAGSGASTAASSSSRALCIACSCINSGGQLLLHTLCCACNHFNTYMVLSQGVQLELQVTVTHWQACDCTVVRTGPKRAHRVREQLSRFSPERGSDVAAPLQHTRAQPAGAWAAVLRRQAEVRPGHGTGHPGVLWHVI
jgi:hypothetical protein